MAIRDVVTMGYGSFGTIPRVVMLGYGVSVTADIASLSGCVTVCATLQGRIEIVPTLDACAKINPTLQGRIEVKP